jgi:hypothetical protein
MIYRDPKTKIFSGRIVSHTVKDGKVTFDVASLPFDKDPPHAPQFYEALGRLVVLWGRFEHHLETSLRTLIAVAKTHGIEQEMYASFGRNAKAFRELYRDVPPLAHQYKDADALMTRAEDTGEERNRLIHSSMNGWGDTDPPFIKLRGYELHPVPKTPS